MYRAQIEANLEFLRQLVQHLAERGLNERLKGKYRGYTAAAAELTRHITNWSVSTRETANWRANAALGGE